MQQHEHKYVPAQGIRHKAYGIRNKAWGICSSMRTHVYVLRHVPSRMRARIHVLIRLGTSYD
jgi:hypothetical protein